MCVCVCCCRVAMSSSFQFTMHLVRDSDIGILGREEVFGLGKRRHSFL